MREKRKRKKEREKKKMAALAVMAGATLATSIVDGLFNIGKGRDGRQRRRRSLFSKGK